MNNFTPFFIARTKLVQDLILKYPNTSKRALSRILRRDFPGYFKDEEEARQVVRYWLGCLGKKFRKQKTVIEYGKQVQSARIVSGKI